MGTRWRTLPKSSTGARADPMRRAVGADQIREARLDRLIALTQRVVLGVGDLRAGVAVVQPVVMRDLRREARELGRRLLAAEPLDRAASVPIRPIRGSGCQPPRAPLR